MLVATIIAYHLNTGKTYTVFQMQSSFSLKLQAHRMRAIGTVPAPTISYTALQFNWTILFSDTIEKESAKVGCGN